MFDSSLPNMGLTVLLADTGSMMILFAYGIRGHSGGLLMIPQAVRCPTMLKLELKAVGEVLRK